MESRTLDLSLLGIRLCANGNGDYCRWKKSQTKGECSEFQ